MHINPVVSLINPTERAYKNLIDYSVLVRLRLCQNEVPVHKSVWASQFCSIRYQCCFISNNMKVAGGVYKIKFGIVLLMTIFCSHQSLCDVKRYDG